MVNILDYMKIYLVFYKITKKEDRERDPSPGISHSKAHLSPHLALSIYYHLVKLLVAPFMNPMV